MYYGCLEFCLYQFEVLIYKVFVRVYNFTFQDSLEKVHGIKIFLS
jgi:hypothetical protein